MKKNYEKPMFTEQTIGYINKFQTSYYERKTTEIDGVAIKDIVKKYGSPVFVFSERTLRENIQLYQRTFRTYYPKITFAWSYKTNYLGAICSILHQHGCPAEVVSQFEYEKAKHLGVDPSTIIFNGPNKTAASLEQAAKDKAMINLDNFDEIYRLEEIAAKLNRKIDVGMRINLNPGIYPLWSRFGFNYESEQAFAAAKRIVSGGKLKLTGLHCHIGTFILTPNAYQVAAEKLIYFAGILKSQLKQTIEYIDLGGGFPSKNKLKGIYLPPDFTIPSIDEYAKAIGDTFLQQVKPEEYPTVYLESGRAIIDDAGYLVSSITGSKRLPDGRKSYIIDAGINLLYTSVWYDIPVKVGIDIEGAAEDVILYGPLCMNIDVVRDTVKLPPLSIGTPLVFSPVGAYCVTQWMQFIEYRPNVILINENGKPEVIREREQLEDIINKERIPDRLKLTRQGREPK